MPGEIVIHRRAFQEEIGERLFDDLVAEAEFRHAANLGPGVAANTPPARPSTVFPGLIEGASLFRPMAFPTK